MNHSTSTTLYLMRHGQAEDAGPGQQDSERSLSEEGILKTRASCKGMQAMGVAPDLVVVSPLLRARQTAHIVHSHLCPKVPIEISEEMVPGSELTEFLSEVYHILNDHKNILCVGHEPSLSSWVYELGFKEHQASRQFKKGAVCAIEFKGEITQKKAKLIFYKTSKELIDDSTPISSEPR